jgi:hypothetical protein
VGAGAPRAAIEFVDLMARLAAEQLGQDTVAPRQHVHRQVLGSARHREGVAALGDTDQKFGRLHAGLGGETHETTRRDTGGLGCHHERRVIQHRHQVIERFVDHFNIMNPRVGF